MERLNRQGPSVQLTEGQKAELAELDSRYRAKLAEREIFLREQMDQARGSGDWESLEQLEKQLVSEKKVLQAELEEKKEAVRGQSGKG